MTPEIAKSLDNLRQIWAPEKTCLTCTSYESNHMTKVGMGHCKHDPNWTSRPHNWHCSRHEMADNAAAQLEWAGAK